MITENNTQFEINKSDIESMIGSLYKLSKSIGDGDEEFIKSQAQKIIANAIRYLESVEKSVDQFKILWNTVFGLLKNITPGTIFELSSQPDRIFMINQKMQVMCKYKNSTDNEWELSNFIDIEHLLCFNTDISRVIGTLTKEEKAIIEYCRVCKHFWIVKSVDNKLYAFNTEPVRNTLNEWVANIDSDGGEVMDYNSHKIELYGDISFIDPYDNLPYYIGSDHITEEV